MRRCRFALLALASALVAAACADGDGDASPATTAPATDTSELEAVALATAIDCPPPVPDDERVGCLEVEVEPGIVLPVAVIAPPAPTDAEVEPLLYISGGPGYSGLADVGFLLESPVVEDRDVVVFDQRGTGAARPVLDCPEVHVAVDANQMAAEEPGVEDDRIEDALLACRDRLVAEGIDLDAFDTVATARDVDTLRRALGHERWHVWGFSYGGLVLQELLRSYPDGIASAVLDAPRPLGQLFAGPALGEVALAAIEALFAACADDAACAGAYRTFEADFRALVAEWDADPFPVLASAADGTERSYLVTGGDVVGGTFSALYDTGLIPVLPSLVEVLRARDDGTAAIVRPLLEQQLRDGTFLAEGHERSVRCHDEGPLLDGAPVDADLDPLVHSFTTEDLGAGCDAWGVEPADAAFVEPVASDVRALVLVGALDPIHPPSMVRPVAEALGGTAQLVELPGMGHGIVFAGGCGHELLRTFLAGRLDTSCVDALGPPEWALP